MSEDDVTNWYGNQKKDYNIITCVRVCSPHNYPYLIVLDFAHCQTDDSRIHFADVFGGYLSDMRFLHARFDELKSESVISSSRVLDTLKKKPSCPHGTHMLRLKA